MESAGMAKDGTALFGRRIGAGFYEGRRVGNIQTKTSFQRE